MASGTEMKMGTKNGFIGAGIMVGGSLAARVASWVILIYNNKKIVDEAKTLSLGFAVAGIIALLVSYLIMYNTYSQKGEKNPMRLHAIAEGQSWVIPAFAIFLVTELILFGAEFAWMAAQYSKYASKAAICAMIGIIVDTILFFIGKTFFKPDMIQKA